MKSLNAGVDLTNVSATTQIEAGNTTVPNSLDAMTSIFPAAKLLSEMPIGQACIVKSLNNSGGAPEWVQQLEDIGFIVGEPVTIMARGAFGGDPLVVRVGLSTFALRKAEAACVLVVPENNTLKVAA